MGLHTFAKIKGAIFIDCKEIDFKFDSIISHSLILNNKLIQSDINFQKV